MSSTVLVKYPVLAFQTQLILTPFTARPGENQESGFSQLLFSLSFKVAYCIYAFQLDIKVYDFGAIRNVVFIKLVSLLLATAALYRQRNRYSVFWLVLLAKMACRLFCSSGSCYQRTFCRYNPSSPSINQTSF